MSSLRKLAEKGQSIWLDTIRRSLITSGELKRWVAKEGLRGITSNPAIFEKAIAGSSDYSITEDTHLDAMALYEKLAIRDIQDAADILHSVYKDTHGLDGYVSMEVSPYLAQDAEGTNLEARRLWNQIARENIMIKIPATGPCVSSIRQMISEGLSINVTLLFSVESFVNVANAYIDGLEKFAAKGGDFSKVASVASFFVSRIDTWVDQLLSDRLKRTDDPTEKNKIQKLLGKTAIANAKIAYQRYKEIYSSKRWKDLEKRGARPQRLLWASTSTKNHLYRDVLYVEELIGPNTVNTVPPATLDAFVDHGEIRDSLEENVQEAYAVFEAIKKFGISMEKVTNDLLIEAVRLFCDPFDTLLATVEQKRQEERGAKLNRLSYKLPQALESGVKDVLENWRKEGKVRRLWAKDATLWTGTDEAKWMGWLDAATSRKDEPRLLEFAKEVHSGNWKHVLLMGMGGSSLCAEVLEMTFGKISGFPQLHVLDSTNPAQVASFESRIDWNSTLFIVASKSGSTLEPSLFQHYFFQRLKEKLGETEAGKRFIAVTDPGSLLQKTAEQLKFRCIFPGVPSIGGRYSALSYFGMVPAAAMGIDIDHFMDCTQEMVTACAPSVPPSENPGVLLGAILGVAGKQGRDKVSLIISPQLWDLGAWLEQLVAESTGKNGHGLIPVDREKLGSPNLYGNDRIFVYLRHDENPDPSQDENVGALEKAGHAVVKVSLKNLYHLGQEFFRWEIATAVCGSVLGVNPFNQPDVEFSKVETRKLTDEFEKTGKLPSETPFFQGEGISLFTDEANRAQLDQIVGNQKSLGAYFKAHLQRCIKANSPADYFGLLAYLEMNHENEEELQAIRLFVRDRAQVATCVQFGPRFLHSTGQAYKGGPNSGVFLQLTSDVEKDVPVPGKKYTFGVVEAAQARGDFRVLSERKRRLLRVHLGKDVLTGLKTLRLVIEKTWTLKNVGL